MRGATTCTGRPNWSKSDRAAPAQMDRAGTLRNRDVEAALLVVQHAGARQRACFGNVVQPGMDAALSRQRSRVQIPSFPLIVRSITARRRHLRCILLCKGFEGDVNNENNRQSLAFGQACSKGASCTCNAAAAGSIPVLSTMTAVTLG